MHFLGNVRFFGLVALSALGSAALLLPATEMNANHAWGNLHWSRTGELQLRLRDNVGTAWDASLALTSSDWSRSPVIATTVVPGAENAATCPYVAGQVTVCSGRYGDTGWKGLAQVVSRGSHIVKARVFMNETYMANSSVPWRNLVMCQEVGHTFGLAHQDEKRSNRNLGTCMDYTNRPTGGGSNGPLNNEHPNAHDFAELARIYRHNDRAAAVEDVQVSDVLNFSPAAFGQPVRLGANRQPIIYRQTLRPGEFVYTFVNTVSASEVGR